MRINSKKGICLVIGLSMLMPMANIAGAHATDKAVMTENTIITPYADVIVTKYRNYNGEQQYRRWNETRGYWVDPYWINI